MVKRLNLKKKKECSLVSLWHLVTPTTIENSVWNYCKTLYGKIFRFPFHGEPHIGPPSFRDVPVEKEKSIQVSLTNI